MKFIMKLKKKKRSEELSSVQFCEKQSTEGVARVC